MAFGMTREAAENRSASVFAKDLVVKGDIENQGDLRVDGKLTGNILGTGTITVAEPGEVCGNVEGQRVIVMGRVDGNVTGTQRVEILEKAVVQGDVVSGRISVDEGAVVTGMFKTMVSSPDKQEAVS